MLLYNHAVQVLLYYDVSDAKGSLSDKYVMLSAKCQVWSYFHSFSSKWPVQNMERERVLWYTLSKFEIAGLSW